MFMAEAMDFLSRKPTIRIIMLLYKHPGITASEIERSISRVDRKTFFRLIDYGYIVVVKGKSLKTKARMYRGWNYYFLADESLVLAVESVLNFLLKKKSSEMEELALMRCNLLEPEFDI